jgi:hypothetical protein
MCVDELPVLDVSAAQPLALAFPTFVEAHKAPPPPREEWKPSPILAAGQPLTFDNLRARNALRANGYDICPVAADGTLPPKFPSTYHMQTGIPWNDEYPGHKVGLLGHAVVTVDWAVTAAAAEAYARIGAVPRGAEVAARVVEHVERLARFAPVAIRREAERVTFVFVADGIFGQDVDARRSAKRPDGYDMPNASVRITCRARGEPAVIDGEGWSVDFLTTPRASLAKLAAHEFAAALADIEKFLAAGAGLDAAPQSSEPEPEAVAPRRGRKGAAAA